MSVHDEARGEEARRILQSDLYKEAYSQVEANVVARLAQASTPPVEAEQLRQLLIALRKVRTYLEQVLQTGTMKALVEKESTIRSLLRRRA